MIDNAHPTSAFRRQYVKMCDVRDFDDPALRERIRSILPSLEGYAEAHRKHWEYANLTLFLEDVGKLDERAEVLSIGAGHEEVLYWLANRVGRVVATDIYGEGVFVEREANALMLSDPATFAPYPYRAVRLEVHSMDGRSLDFADESFDVVFSLSAIEHFGSSVDIARAAREIGRVLKSGGYAFVVTECFLHKHPLNSRLVPDGPPYSDLRPAVPQGDAAAKVDRRADSRRTRATNRTAVRTRARTATREICLARELAQRPDMGARQPRVVYG